MKPSASRIFVMALLWTMTACTLCLGYIYWSIYGFHNLFGDFDVFYGAARHAVLGQWTSIYDVAHLRQAASNDDTKELVFFLNPPTTLLLIYPLGFLSFTQALLAWSAVQLALLLMVLRMDAMQRLFARENASQISSGAILLVPFLSFALLNFLYGQVAVFCTVLFLLVFLWRNTYPVRAGIVLGIFSFKPQLGVLLPLLLLAEKNWTVLLIATLSFCVFAGLSVLSLGLQLWQDYQQTVSILSYFLSKTQPVIFFITTSVYAAFRNIGVTATPALMLQAVVSIIVLFLLWPVLRKGKESHKILILSFATYLVTPYSLIYDMTLLAIPCALFLRRAELNVAALPELITLLFLILMPVAAIMLQILHIPYCVIAIGFGLVVARTLVLKELHG